MDVDLNEIIEQSDKVYRVGDIIIDERFWDCECEERYIHAFSSLHCALCGATQEDQPNARANEILDPKLHATTLSQELATLYGYEVI